MAIQKTTYQEFKQTYLIQDYRGINGQPVHTRYIKKKFFWFAKQLKDEFGFDMFTCSECGCSKHNGKPIVLELDHLNRITNDARIINLSMKCPNCHSQTNGYKNRKSTIEEYYNKLINLQR